MTMYRIVSLLMSWAVDHIQLLFVIMLSVCTAGSIILFRRVKEDIREMNRDFDKEKYQRKNNRNKRYRK